MIADSITKLQTALRCWLLRKKFRRNRRAAVTIQAWLRGEHTRATVGREMADLVRKRKEKEAQEAEAARALEAERQKQLEEQAVAVRLEHVSEDETFWPFFPSKAGDGVSFEYLSLHHHGPGVSSHGAS